MNASDIADACRKAGIDADTHTVYEFLLNRPYATPTALPKSAKRFIAMQDGRCGSDVRGQPNDVCMLKAGHAMRGRKPGHSCVVFECDGCYRILRGQPHQRHPEVGGFCFLCSGPPAQRKYRRVEYEELVQQAYADSAARAMEEADLEAHGMDCYGSLQGP